MVYLASANMAISEQQYIELQKQLPDCHIIYKK